MLGELIGECKGKVVGVRVLPTDGPHAKVEVSLQGQGTLLGQPIADFGTYVQSVRASGALQGDAHNIMISPNGDVADWIGGGVGRPTGPGFKASYGAYGRFDASRGALARLETIATTVEYEVAEDGSYHWRMWEWTGPKAK
jgi:hypothetical protein